MAKDSGIQMRLTLMKPPSGFARRNAGCELILGSISCTAFSFLNRGIGPRALFGPCDGGYRCRGVLTSRPNMALS